MPSNLPEFAAALHHIADTAADMTRSVPGGSVGNVLLDRQALRIQERAANGQGTKGAWAANKGEYGREKAKAGLPVGVGLKPSDSPMLSLEQIRGEQQVSGDTASMAAGTSPENQLKAQYFENGSTGSDGSKSGAKGQRARPWFGLTDSDADAITEDFADLAIESLLNGA
jgi:hypothetical protein